jgi:tetratricopeptide (TPR) repeat protein
MVDPANDGGLKHEGSALGERTAPHVAVFLSYASQDAAAARRMCGSLRTAGVEVWFDADGGLQHGDEWDAKIRRQIKECVLFIPIISANTQARAEGYFRIEWELAAQRAMGIASSVAFILPVAIDRTREADALVPDRFRAVQWTTLPEGEFTPEARRRFLALWSHRIEERREHAAISPDQSARRAIDPAVSSATKPARRRTLLAVILTSTTVAIAVGGWFLQSKRVPVPKAAEAPAITEARKLMAKAWDVLNGSPEPARAELDAAGEFCRRATDLDSTDGEVWATWAFVESWYVAKRIDPSAARKESARLKASRAMTLAPKAYLSRLAHACNILRAESLNKPNRFTAEAEEMLRTLLREQPAEPHASFALAHLVHGRGQTDDAIGLLRQLANQPGWAATAQNTIGWILRYRGRWDEALAAAEASIAARPHGSNLALQMYIARDWLGNLELAKSAVERLAAHEMKEDFSVNVAVTLYWWRREPKTMLRVLAEVPREWLQANVFYSGPKGYWVGVAQEMAGNREAAEVAWRAALRLVDQRLVDEPSSTELHVMRGQLLGLLRDQAGAATAYAIAVQMGGPLAAPHLLAVGRVDEALIRL